jgi:hypothetical protein
MIIIDTQETRKIMKNRFRSTNHQFLDYDEISPQRFDPCKDISIYTDIY